MKTFTLSEANAALIEIEADLQQLRRHNDLLKASQAEAEAASSSSRFGGGMPSGTAYITALCGLRDIAAAITERGIEIKDISRGLIDFPSLRNGRIVYLCWQLGEGSEIEFWHEQDGGFAGRKPL